MSTTETFIGEHDVVTLRKPVEGWPVGTRGTVVSMFPSHRWVEIVHDDGEDFDIVSVRPQELELVWKCPWSTSEHDGD
ncbi:MAG: hypothetical protein ACRDPE_10315 [Solirubrobacterales bacterium]